MNGRGTGAAIRTGLVTVSFKDRTLQHIGKKLLALKGED